MEEEDLSLKVIDGRNEKESNREDRCKENNNDQMEENLTERRKRLIKQGLLVFLSSLGMWTLGSMLSFPSVVASDLNQRPNMTTTTIFGQLISLSDSQMDMMSSLTNFFSLPGVWLIAPIMNTFGRRPSMALSGILLIVGWLGVALFPGAVGLLIARGICGLGMGCASVSVNAYGIEISDPVVRGIMFIISNNGVLAGQVVTMGLGYQLRYYIVALVNLILPLGFVVSQIWLPESPGFLVVKGRQEAAREVLLQLRGPSVDLDSEIKGYESLNETSEGRSLLWKELMTPKVLKSLFIVSMLFIFMQFTGYLVVIANASRIFAESGSSIDDSLAALIVTIVQLLSGLLASFLIDRLGRKKSLFLSYIIMCFALTGLATYVGMVNNANAEGGAEGGEGGTQPYGWIPLVCLMMSQAGVALGVNPVPFLLTNEYFPTSIRSQASSICHTVGSLSGVAVLQLYTPMRQRMTQTGLYAFYAFVCVLGAAFTSGFVRETKGQEIG